MTTTTAPRRAVLWRRLGAVLAASALLGAGLLVVDAGASHRPLTAAPKDGNRAVRDGQPLFLNGHGPAGAVTAARILGLGADGALVGAQDVGGSALNASPEREGSFVRNDDGDITGRFGLGCLFGAGDGPGAPNCPHPAGLARSAQVEVTLDTDEVLTSTVVPVDTTFPVIRRYEVVAPGVIRVLFSEPVRHEQGDSVTDWTVEDALVTAVDDPPGNDCELQPGDDARLGLGDCVRLLRVVGLPEDAEPHVEYAAGPNRLGAVYEDYTDNGLDRSDATGSGARSDAVDLVRPAAPRVDRIAGKAPQGDEPAVTGRQTEPVVQLGGLTPGHEAQVVVTMPSGSSTASDWVVARDDGTASIVVPALSEQGAHLLEAVARDVNGNTSAERDKQPAREDGGPSSVSYVLDTVVPFVMGALAAPDGVAVSLSEPVTGPDRPADWAVESGSGAKSVTAVTGSGDRRQLTVEPRAVPGDRLTYAPRDDQRYADDAGNVVADITTVLSGLPAPSVLQPDAELFTRATSEAVAGTVREGASVDVFRDQDRDGQPDEDEPLRTLVAGGDGTWSVDVPLLADQANHLLVQAGEPDGGRSPLATVPRIVQDATPPRLEVLAPRGTDVLPGGEPTEVEWSTSDANAGDARMQVELATDGETFVQVAAAPARDGSVAVTLPKVSTSQAVVRLATSDLAGNTATELSPPFTIDAVPPTFTARTVAPRRVEVLFSEPVSGPLGPDWRVAGSPAAVESANGSGSAARAREATVLVLATSADFDPDAEPDVTYAPPLGAATGELVDAAGQPIDPGARTRQAVDRIRPAKPSISRIEGRPLEGGRVVGNTASPLVSVQGVRPGNTVWVEAESADGSTADGQVVEATGTTADVRAPSLPGDGAYTLRVVAKDPSDNRSDDDALRPASADRSPNRAGYVLDQRVPVLTAAVPEGDDLRVRISEAVDGPNTASDWTVTGRDGERPVTRVAGSGDSRLLTVEGGAPAGGELRYAPSGDRYADPAGNRVGDTVLVIAGVPLPVVTNPSAPLLTNANPVTIGGTSEPGTVVELFREGQTAGEPLGSAAAGSDGGWQLPARLDVGQDNRFIVRAADGEGERSGLVPVPVITSDQTPPELSVQEPVGGQLYRGGGDAVVRWRTSDANPSPTGIRVELLVGGELVLVPAEAAAPEAGRVEYRLPAVDTDRAQVRVISTDAAGNRSTVTTPRFRIDAVHPVFGALTVGQREVHVRFSEPVSGTLGPADFTVAGAPAVVERVDGQAVGSTPRVSGARDVVLRTTATIGPNDTPLVQYAPSAVGQLTDAAGNPVRDRLVRAVDGIVPVPPSVTEPAGTVYEADVRRTYSGRSELGTTVRLVDRDGAAASPQVRTDDDGAWTLRGELRRDAHVVLSAVAVDDAGNTSRPNAAPTVVQDSRNPDVSVRSPRKGQQLPLDSDVEVRWLASDANLARNSVVVDVTTDGGQSWTELGRDEEADGSLTWRTPSEPTSEAAVRVRALDLAGRTGSAVEGFFGVGAPASGGSPSPGAGQQPLPGAGGQPGVDVELTVPERFLGALPRTGADVLRMGLLALVVQLTGAGLLVAARDQRRLRRRRA